MSFWMTIQVKNYSHLKKRGDIKLNLHEIKKLSLNKAMLKGYKEGIDYFSKQISKYYVKKTMIEHKKNYIRKLRNQHNDLLKRVRHVKSCMKRLGINPDNFFKERSSNHQWSSNK
jgi:ribosome modulation factor